MLSASTPVNPIRMCGMSGYDGRLNDIVYCHPEIQSEQRNTVVFFGGDVQDFTENMQSHRDNKNYLKWNLEDTAKVILSKFPDCHVVVVRPSKIEYKTFSCFENFVPCNNCGAPEHTPMHYSIQHLEKLLETVSVKLCSMSTAELMKAASNAACIRETTNVYDTPQTLEKTVDDSFCWRENLRLDKNNVTVIGFSKGCVVLNQFLYEFHYLKTLTPDDATMMSFVSRITDMYWLDGGHAGGRNTWITSRSLLETLTRLRIKVHIHVTPYQIQDDRRPWIRKEEKMFGDLLQRLGAPVNRTVHFENILPNLYTHFDVMTVFKQLPQVVGSSK